MMKNEILKSCQLLYAAQSIPLAVCDGHGKLLQAFCSYQGFHVVLQTIAEKVPSEKMLTLTTGLAGLYGTIRIPSDDLLLVAGPFVNKKIGDDTFDSIIHTYQMEWNDLQDLKQFLLSLPRISLNRFLNFIALLQYLFNREEVDVVSYFEDSFPKLQQSVGEKHADELLNENSYAHGTYNLEKQLLSYVSAGDVIGLTSFFHSIAQAQPPAEGKVADDTLRQSKNIFIALICMVGKVGAIRGNLDIEQTYQLIDLYTQECERCSSINEVNRLRYTAILDFTRRVAELKHPQSYSKEVYAAMQFIKTHTNQPLGAQDVIDHVKKSRSVFMAQFKHETGETIGRYIIKSKLQEAKLLLAYSDRSLPAIANFLFFSSQSHFQNAFKKEFGITPLEYRRKHYKE